MSQHQLLITFATLNEAEYTIKKLDAKQSSATDWHFDKGTISITGTGCFSTLRHLMRLVPLYQEIWNIGIAGALNESLSIGNMYSIDLFSKHLLEEQLLGTYSSEFGKRLFPQIQRKELQEYHLLTVDSPIHCELLKKKLSLHHDIVDMEGYAVAWLCHQENKPYHVYKLISDVCSENGPAYIQERLPLLSKSIGNFIEKQIKEHKVS